MNSHCQTKPMRATTISALREPSCPTPSPRRKVTISETNQMVYVTDLSEGPQKADLWFTEEEMQLFGANVSSYVNFVQLRIAKGRAPGASNILGIEKFLTPQLMDEYRHRRERLLEDVVGESCWQQEQLRRASQCEREVTLAQLDFFADRLASAAAEHSRWARERARAAALFLYQDQEIEREARRRPEGRTSLPRRIACGEGALRPGRSSYPEEGRPGPFIRAVSPSHG